MSIVWGGGGTRLSGALENLSLLFLSAVTGSINTSELIPAITPLGLPDGALHPGFCYPVQQKKGQLFIPSIHWSFLKFLISEITFTDA